MGHFTHVQVSLHGQCLEVGLLCHGARAPVILTDAVKCLIHWDVNFCLPPPMCYEEDLLPSNFSQHSSPEVDGTPKRLSNIS